MSETRLTKSNVLAATDRFFELASANDAETLADTVRDAVAAYKAGAFRLVVVGEIKKGKSSLINALLEEWELLPVEMEVSTSTVYEVGYGDTPEFTVVFNPMAALDAAMPGEEVPPRQEKKIDAAEIAAYGTETGNPGNEKEVDFIRVQLPHPLLEGFVIVDTPGLGGMVAEHADITWKQASRADAFCFVLDSVEAVVSLPELDGFSKFLEVSEKVGVGRPPFFFVQTKTDANMAWEAFRAHNLASLSAHFDVPQEALRYFPVSATVKVDAVRLEDPQLLAESGFPELLAFLHDTLHMEQAERLGQKILQLILTATQAIHDRIAEELRLYHASQEEVEAFARQATATAKGFATWEEEKYPQLVEGFEARALELREETRNQLRAALNAGENSPIVTPMIQKLKNANLGRKELFEKSGSLHAECVEECQEVVFSILEEYQEKMDTLIQDTTAEFETSLEYAFTSAATSLSLGNTAKEITMPSLSDNAGLEFTVGVILLSVLLVKVSPLALVALPLGAIVACAVIGRHLFKRFLRGEQEALSQLQSLLIEVVQQAQEQAILQFEGSSAAIEGEVQDLLETAREETAKEFARRIDAITSAQAETQAEKQRKAAVLEAQVAQAETLLHTIEEMLGEPESAASDATPWRTSESLKVT